MRRSLDCAPGKAARHGGNRRAEAKCGHPPAIDGGLPGKRHERRRGARREQHHLVDLPGQQCLARLGAERCCRPGFVEHAAAIAEAAFGQEPRQIACNRTASRMEERTAFGLEALPDKRGQRVHIAARTFHRDEARGLCRRGRGIAHGEHANIPAR